MIYLYIVSIFIFFGCDSVGNKKVYKTFDFIEGDLSLDQQLDESRWSGGPGFEEISPSIVSKVL